MISPEALGPLGLTPALAADRFSSAYLIAAAGRAIRDVASLDAGARAAGQRIATLTLEADIRFASAASRAGFAEELSSAIARLTAKYHDERARGGRPFRLLAAVHPTPTKDTTHGKHGD